MITRLQLETWLNKNWYGSSRRSRLLTPLMWLFVLLSGINKRLGQMRAYKARVPVVVVGNISVGGSGKTPMVIALVERLKEKGYHPAVISRGYGSQAPSYPWFVDPSQSSVEAGDEPLLLAQSCLVPVVIGADRKASIEAVMVQYPQTDILVCDDGLQHYRLQRDIEIAVVDGARGLGNAKLLPVGPLRESPKRLRQVDFVVSNGRLQAPLATALPVSTMTLEPQALQLVSSLALAKDRGEFDLQLQQQAPQAGDRVHLVTGIGNPERFKQSLSELKLDFDSHIYADHHEFAAEDLQLQPERAIVMTAKDAIKCRRFAPDNTWYLPVKAQLPESFWHRFEQMLQKFNHA